MTFGFRAAALAWASYHVSIISGLTQNLFQILSLPQITVAFGTALFNISEIANLLIWLNQEENQ